MRTGIYGGSFNPPHLGHLIVAETIRDQFQLDRILWIPGYIPPHKQHLQLAAPHHRLEMTRLATDDHPAFEVSTIELDRKGTSYTVDTLRSLHQELSGEELFLIIGGDSLRDFMTWKSPEQVAEFAHLLVFNRDTVTALPTEAERRFPNRISLATAPLIEISSRAIRERIKNRQSVRYLLPANVHQYIVQQNLYE